MAVPRFPSPALLAWPRSMAATPPLIYSPPMTSKLERRILDALLGKPLVTNAFRGMMVEAMLAEVLEPD